MYVNKSGNQISDDKYNKLSPAMKARYSKVPKPVAKDEAKPKPAKPAKKEKEAEEKK